MPQCQCITKDGKGPRCSRMAEDDLCIQHKKKCDVRVGSQVVQKPLKKSVQMPLKKSVQMPLKKSVQMPLKRSIQRLAQNPLKRSKSSAGCTEQSLKKYVSRPSPPFPANQCCGLVMTGNDGLQYISKAASNGVCRWIKAKN